MRWSGFRRAAGADPPGDVDAELLFHLEMRIRERIERGETPEGARQWALARFGDYEAARAECVMIGERRGRRMARTHWVTDAWQDVRYAVRNLRKRRGFAVVAVLTLALGIGANSSIFSVVNAVLLRSLPYRDAGQLYNVETVYPDGTGYALSAPDFMSVRESHRVFEDVGALTGGVRTLLGRDEPREVLAAQVSDGFFELIGMPVVLGRSFRAEENQPGRTSVTILENGFWRREFGADQGVVGRTLDLAGTPYTVVGVLAPGVGIQGDWDLYTPLSYDSSFDAGTAFARRSEFLYAIGRARAGQTPSQISADMRRVGAELQARFANTNESLTFDVTSFRDGILGDVRRPLLILLGAVGFVLLVACANVANLLLARASSRQGELAVRAALGAGRRRLVRQLVAEALVLGLIGGVLGLGLAFAGTTALVRAQPADIPRLTEVGVDGMVVAFTFTIALFTGFLFGVVPALQATSARLMNAMREGGRGGSGTGGQRLRSALIVAEMASAVVLLVGAGLLVRSFIELTRVDPGFRAEQAVTFRLSLQGSRYAEGQQIRNYFTALSDRLRAVPGVTHVGGSSLLPMSGFSSILSFSVEGAPPPPSNVNPEIAVASVTPQYFDAIGTPLMAGRMFEAQDRSDAPPVVLINEAAVQRWFSGENPVGRRVNVGGLREVVGVVGDVLHRDPGTPPGPQLYVPYDQRTTRTLRIVVRAQGDPLALVAAIRREVRALDANLPLTEITPLRALVDASLARPRFYTSMLTLFAGVALALAAIGIFGVMSYSVAQRQREISVRMALGARRSAVIAMITGRALALAAAGLALGLFAAFALARILESQLFGVAAFDPLTVFVVVLVLGTSAAAASFLPARRAAALDPGLALRDG